ncbi:MAG: hypothetical protein A4E63_02766 [Syntrophorhabdus sp. PtaU1.Bin050]|nr:MAG: hypothetical protein A4E63_02766 [Syntrophorhabdus sp. PtaU1.Bin050]
MEFYEVRQCDEYCPFYEKSHYEHRFGKDTTTYERCTLLGYDYNDPNQVLVRLWAKRRREVEDSYKHVRIVDRPNIDKAFPPVPDFCPVKQGPVVVMLQKEPWKRFPGKAFLFDHYGDSPVGRIKAHILAEEEQRRKERKQRRIERESKKKEKEEKKIAKQNAHKVIGDDDARDDCSSS